MATLDDFGTLAKQKYVDTLKDYNAKVEQAKSVSSIDEFSSKFMETAPELAEENAKIAKLEDALEQIKAARLIKATPLIQPAYEAAVAVAGVDVTALDEQLKTLRVTAKYLVSIYGEDVLDDTDKIASRSKTGGSSGAGAGGRRIRGFEVYIDGVLAAQKNAEGVLKSTFSIAAKMLEVETVDLQRAFFAEAGSEDTKSDDFPAVVEFEFKEHNIKVAKVDDSSE
jgi:hypothetical protein